ncbi:hypothetical protein HOU24_gp56 [Corynebacterium phage SamW]|uniref:Uncharacterized protein n=4 Tax=Samwavirus TaxID=2733208 RepID=A0A385UG82_9CAUD|nr:hypothetical protein HOU24_gp56 [Corynebacterium phage SamW]YP_009848815.1 hypothetical protein HWC43_gp59 [Corynebacterium phage Dina]YP_009849036.1 hypothetical protein HWC46_gp57 [Corynebacterium phage Lederberg]AYQ98833.1 hypothetical protein TROY_56 [Corynebacterium phage Troy]AYB70538.1 hypothetical protein SAMW_56 [Corynebacterium phage SamW]QDF19679.1 hypothetical protein SEA_DINA_59 [Corynebacterium phage Dina]QDF20104.1 hypothetical protein SEA_LEDERBERG_57 [Corynebacterium phage
MTPDKAVDHAMDCLRDATTGLTITKEYESSNGRGVCQWFTLGPITNCNAHATETALDKISLTVQIGIVTSVRVSLTLDEGRDTAILRDAVNLYVNHYGMEADQ